MKICIYCGENPAISSEHILQDAFGSAWQRKGILCHSCNTLFGNTLDKGLAADFRYLRNLLGIKNRRGIVPETNVIDDTGVEYTRTGNGNVLGGTKPHVEHVVNGKEENFSIHAELGAQESIIKNIQDYAKKVGAKNSSMTTTSYNSIYPGKIQGKISLGLPTFVALRKSLFNFLSCHIPKQDQHLFFQETKKIYEFARKMPFLENEDYEPAKKMNIDGHPFIVHLSTHLSKKIYTVSPIANSLFLLSKNDALYGGVVLFGSLRFGMKLFDGYTGDSIVRLTIMAPNNKTVIHDNSFPEDDFNFLDLDVTGYTESLKEQIAELMPKCILADYKRAIEEVFDARGIDKMFPISNIQVIHDILVEKMSVLFCGILLDEGVYYSFFASEIGKMLSSSFVNLFLKERNIKELGKNEYEQFILDAYQFLKSIKEDKNSDSYEIIRCIKWLNERHN